MYSLPLVTPPPLRPCPAVPAGYECEPYNNPADFFLDIINGDSTAVAMSKADETDTGMKHGAEGNYHSVDFARRVQHNTERSLTGVKQPITMLNTHTVIFIHESLTCC